MPCQSARASSHNQARAAAGTFVAGSSPSVSSVAVDPEPGGFYTRRMKPGRWVGS